MLKYRQPKKKIVTKKTIIQVWTQQRNQEITEETQPYWGLGDMIRGTIALHQYCKKYGHEFYVDIHLHPISKYILGMEHPYTQYIDDNLDQIDIICDKIGVLDSLDFQKYIKQRNEDVICIFTNACCRPFVAFDTKKLIQEILSPTPDFLAYLNLQRKLIPYNSYNVLHMRIGDDELVHGNSSIEKLNSISSIIEKKIESNDVLFSDSLLCKQKMAEKYKICTLDTTPAHIGLLDEEKIRDSLVDFFLVMQSKKIKTYSSYTWISGFVYWTHVIYDIPLENLRPDPEQNKKPDQEVILSKFSNSRRTNAHLEEIITNHAKERRTDIQNTTNINQESSNSHAQFQRIPFSNLRPQSKVKVESNEERKQKIQEAWNAARMDGVSKSKFVLDKFTKKIQKVY